MKELGISYKDLMWGIPWAIITRMMADLPRTIEKKENENKVLNEQTSDDFKAFIQQLNEKKKQK